MPLFVTFWLSGKVSKMALFLVQEAEYEFRGTPREGGLKRGQFWGSIFGQKGVILDPHFGPYPPFGRHEPGKGGFRGCQFGVNKMALFQTCQKCHFLDFEWKLRTRARARASVIYGKRLGRGSKKGSLLGSLLRPLF